MAQANIKAVITAEDRASGALRGFGKNVEGLQNQIIGVAKKASLILAAVGTAAATMGVKTAASLEASRQGFVTLLGSAEAADKTMARIRQEAKRTPFEIAGLTAASQMLAGVTKNGDRAIDFILDIGEGLAAMGRGQAELDRIAVNLQQIAATGRAFSIDIKQFAFAGIPIFEMLQKETGLAGEALADFIEEGGVTFEMLEKMFKSATEEGGRFFGAYKNQAGTFNQLFSNMKDSVNIFLADFVKQIGLFDAAKAAMSGFTNAISGNNTALNNLIVTIKSWAGAALSAVQIIIGYLQPAFTALWNTIATRLLPQLKALWDAVQPGFTTALKILAGIVGLTVIGALRLFVNILNVTISVVGGLVRAVSNVIKWLGNFGSSVISSGRAVTRAFGGIANSIIGPFKSAFNAIAMLWNNTVGKLSFKVPSWVPKLGGKGWDVPDIPTYAQGTNFHPGGMAIVGEQGPELVNLPRGSSVTPNGKSATTVNLNVNVGMYAGTEMEKRKIAKALYQSLQDAMGPGFRMAS